MNPMNVGKHINLKKRHKTDILLRYGKDMREEITATETYERIFAEQILLSAIERFKKAHPDFTNNRILSIARNTLKKFQADSPSYNQTLNTITALLDANIPKSPKIGEHICTMNPMQLRRAAIQINAVLNAQGLPSHEVDIYKSLQKWQNMFAFRATKLGSSSPSR